VVDRLLSTIATTPWLNAALTDFDFEIDRTANGPAEPVHLADGRTLDEGYVVVSDEGNRYDPLASWRRDGL
jgi:hypothetical protein